MHVLNENNFVCFIEDRHFKQKRLEKKERMRLRKLEAEGKLEEDINKTGEKTLSDVNFKTADNNLAQEATKKTKPSAAEQTGRQVSEDRLSLSSETQAEAGMSEKSQPEPAKEVPIVLSPPGSGKKKQTEKRRPLPGQSQYKVPGYKQTSRACEIS